MPVKIAAPNLMLPWEIDPQDKKRFWKIFLLLFIPCFLFGVVVPFISLPEPDRKELEKLPPQLARVVLEKKVEPPPPPPPKPEKKEEKKPEEKKPEEKKPEPKKIPEPKPEPKKEPPKVELVEKAREEAQAEINEFADALSEMRDEFDFGDLDIATETNAGAGEAETVDRNVISSRAASSTGSIDTSNLSTSTGGKGLASKGTTKVSSKIASAEAAQRAANKRAAAQGKKTANRSAEEIRKVMDSTKARVDAIYNRALRKNPALEGNFKFEMVIESNGSVSSVRIISSELDDKELEAKLLARIRSIHFEAKGVSKTTVEYDYTFLPS